MTISPDPWPRTPFSTILAATISIGFLTACGTPAPDLEDVEKREKIEEMFSDFESDFPKAEEITVQELLDLRAQGEVILVDVREPEERAVSIIPGAISENEFAERASQSDMPPVVAYCTIGYRSGQFVDQLSADGIDAYNLKGSILSWTHAGQPVVDAEGNETRQVHVYGARWNLLPKDYEAVW